MPECLPVVEILPLENSPAEVYASLRRKWRNTFLLESAITQEKLARYSFLGRASSVVTLKDGELRRDGKTIKANPVECLRKLVNHRIPADVKDDIKIPPFSGGLVGFFGYDYVRYLEDIGNSTVDDLKNEDFLFFYVEDAVIFDHFREEVMLISNIIADSRKEAEEKKQKAEKKLKDMREMVEKSGRYNIEFGSRKIEVESNFSRDKFERAVEKSKEYIYNGDIFQVVLSQRFSSPFNGDALDLYLALRTINPSPYMYIIETPEFKLIGASPEILVRKEGKRVVVRPIAGTRARGEDAVEDEALAREMLTDEKERAEHVMLVDLGRNDLGRVCRFGSVKVTEFMTVERYSHVQHLVSNVVGELKESEDAFSVLNATFPAGTVTGAPKVRAMQIIEELEPTRRGAYAGAVGYFSFTGDMDMAITIRSLVLQGGRAYAQAGAGIVADSKPEAEYQETVNKGRAMLKALEMIV